MAKLVSKKMPEWLKKIEIDQFKIKNRLFEARMKFVEVKLQAEEAIEDINNKYKTSFSFEDLITITTEEEEQAIDMLDLDDDDLDDDDDDKD